MNHRAAAGFWQEYQKLSTAIRLRADKQFALLRKNPRHPSLQFKKLMERRGQEIWSARVSLNYRALAMKRPDGFLWFWIGDHKGYNVMIA